MENYTDEQAIIDIRSVEKKKRNDALRYLYKMNFHVIRNYILENNGTEEDAADQFQDAIVVLYDKIRLKQYVMTSSLQTFLYAISRNIWLNKLRKRKSTSSLDKLSVDPVDEYEVPDTKDKDKEQERAIKMISQLDMNCQEVLRLYYYERLRMTEIAERMNFKNDKVAKSKKSKCMRKLRRLLSEIS